MYSAKFFVRGLALGNLLPASGQHATLVLDNPNIDTTKKEDAAAFAKEHNFAAYQIVAGFPKSRPVTDIIVVDR